MSGAWGSHERASRSEHTEESQMLVSCSDPIAFHLSDPSCSDPILSSVCWDCSCLSLATSSLCPAVMICSLDLHLGHPKSSQELDVLLFRHFVDLKLHVLGLLVGLSEAGVAIAGQPFSDSFGLFWTPHDCTPHAQLLGLGGQAGAGARRACT